MDRPWVPAGLKYAWIKEGDPQCLLVQRAARLRGVNGLESRFLRFVIGSPQFTDYIKPIVTGVNVPHISGRQIENFQFPLPPVTAQRKIAEILSAYDDLIENNTQRIRILEEMAQGLYREWLVKPCESVQVARGWSTESVNDFVSIRSGFAFRSTTFTTNGSYGLVTIKNVHDGLFVEECQSRIETLPHSMSEYCHLQTGDILLSLTGNVGRVCFVYGQNYLLNQRVAKLQPVSPENRAFTYFTFRQREFQRKLEMIANGVAQQNLSPIQTGLMEFVLPPASLLRSFSKFAEPIVDQMLSLWLSNANLRRTRDLLLPKLISGEVSVERLAQT